MSKEHSLRSHEKKNTNHMILVISLLAVAVLFIADLNVMINMPANIIAMAGITVLLLIWLYLFIKSMLMEMKKNKLHMQEQFENMLKSEKASFLLLRKAFDEMSQLENNASVPSEDIITAQKAIAKVTISRSKENTDAILNSNDNVMERLFELEEKFSMNNDELIERQKLVFDDSLKEVLMKQQEIVSGIREVETAISNQLKSLSDTINTMQETQAANLQETIKSELAKIDIHIVKDEPELKKHTSLSEDTLMETTPELMDETESEEHTSLSEDTLMETTPELMDETDPEELTALPEESLFEDTLELSGDSEIGEIPDFGEETLQEETLELSDEPELEEISNFDEETLQETVPELSDEPELGEIPDFGEESLIEIAPELPDETESAELSDYEEEPAIETDLFDDLGTREEPLTDSIIEESEMLEPESAAEPAMPDLSAVEAEVLPDETIEASAIAEEFIPDEKHVEEVAAAQEEKPAMPDLSDPHKLMTPDEIAALIANL